MFSLAAQPLQILRDNLRINSIIYEVTVNKFGYKEPTKIVII